MVFWRKLISKQDYFIERRFSGRKDCDIPVLRKDTDSTSDIVVIKNISPYGFGLNSENPFREGQIYELEVEPSSDFFKLESFKNRIITVETIWISKRRQNSKFSAGVKFADTREYIKDSWVINLIESTGLSVDHKIHFRAYIRYPISMNVQYDGLSTNVGGYGMVVNIGAGGIAMETNSQIPLHTNLNLRLGPEFGLQQVSTVGEVRWSMPFVLENKFVHGISFQLPISENNLLYKYVETAAIMHREKKNFSGK